MTFQERAEKAVELKATGACNCAQAVTTVLADQTDLSVEQLRNMTAGFAVGMGNMGATCGALIGAGIAAGLKTSGNRTIIATRQMQEMFNDRCGATRCKDLKQMTDGKPLCPCTECVRQAVLVYGEVLGIE